MTIIRYAAALAILALPLAAFSTPAGAATAHNSQAGGFGQSKNPTASTVNSRRVKHSAKPGRR